jgi:acetylornithine aminotransferase/acetylornithine/N-succinyldiaminopimelate aminotransferase
VVNAMMERKILINRTSETVLRFLPPFILGKRDVDHAIDALDSILTEHAPQAAGAAATGGKYVG